MKDLLMVIDVQKAYLKDAPWECLDTESAAKNIARLIDAGIYDIGTYEFLKGAICGVHSGNYDITHIFIDNFLKLVNDRSNEAITEFFIWLKGFAEKENIDFVVSVSTDAETAPAILKELSI